MAPQPLLKEPASGSEGEPLPPLLKVGVALGVTPIDYMGNPPVCFVYDGGVSVTGIRNPLTLRFRVTKSTGLVESWRHFHLTEDDDGFFSSVHGEWEISESEYSGWVGIEVAAPRQINKRAYFRIRPAQNYSSDRIILTPDNWTREVVNSYWMVLVVVHTQWCEYCQMALHDLPSIIRTYYNNRVKWGTLDVTDVYSANTHLVDKWVDINSVPQMLFFCGNGAENPSRMTVGYSGELDMRAHIDDALMSCSQG